jgi:hypothetical protein
MIEFGIKIKIPEKILKNFKKSIDKTEIIC